MSDAFRRYDPKWVIRGTAYSGFIAFIMQAIGMWILISFFYANSKHGGFETGYTNFVWKMEGGYRSVFISALVNCITGLLSSFLFAFFDSNAISHVNLTNLECGILHRITVFLWLIARFTVYLFLIFRMEVAFRNTQVIAFNVKVWVTIATIGFICYILILSVLGGRVVAAKHPRSYLLKCNSLGASKGKEAVVPIFAVIDFLITVVFVVYFSWTLWKLNNVMKSLEEPSVGSHNSKDLVRARTASGGNESENNGGSPQVSNDDAAGSQEAAEETKQDNFLLKLARRSMIFGLIAVGSTLTFFIITAAGYGSPFISIDAMINAYCILGAYGVPLEWLKSPQFWFCGKVNKKTQDHSTKNPKDGKKSEDAEQLETIISTSSTS